MKKLNKVALVFFVVYLVCWIATATTWMPILRPYAETISHICVLLFVVYLIVEEKTSNSN